MHLQWGDLYYPHPCLLLLGPSFILRGLFCTSCSNLLKTRSYRTSRSHTYPMVVCGSCIGALENTLHWNGSDCLSPNLFIYQFLHKSHNTLFPHFFQEANCPPLLSPTCISPWRAQCGWQEAQGGTLSWVVLILQATKTHLGGKSFFFFFFFHVSLLKR